MNDRLLSEDAITRIKAFAEDESLEWVDVHGDIWNLLAAYADTMRENTKLLRVCRLAIPLLQGVTDCGPYDEGWKSPELEGIISDMEALSNKESANE